MARLGCITKTYTGARGARDALGSWRDSIRLGRGDSGARGLRGFGGSCGGWITPLVGFGGTHHPLEASGGGGQARVVTG